MDIEFVRSRFIKHFDGKTGNIYFSPGRINLIGEHTDYNGGFVFPGAVDKGIMRCTYAPWPVPPKRCPTLIPCCRRKGR